MEDYFSYRNFQYLRLDGKIAPLLMFFYTIINLQYIF